MSRPQTAKLKVPERKTEGLTPPGDVCLYYPSGRVGVMVTRGHELTNTMVYADSASRTVLASFDSNGVGSVCYANGKPWLATTEAGYSLSDPGGNLLEAGKWPREGGREPAVLQVTDSVFATFRNRQSIEVRFNTDDIPERTFNVGQSLRRTEPYTKHRKGTEIGKLAGKLVLDVEQIRSTFRERGHLYGLPGPHSQVTQRPGLGNLDSTIRKLDAAAAVMPVIEDLGSTQRRLRLINTMPVSLYGTARAGKGGAGATGDTLPDFGEPALSATQRAFLRRAPAPSHRRRRAKVPDLSVRDLRHKVLGPGRDEGALTVVCLHATWNFGPCRQALNHMGELQQAVASGELGVAKELGLSVEARLLDVSESNEVQRMFGIRTLPFFLLFGKGRLVRATNEPRTGPALRALVTAALHDTAKGQFLPEDFHFGRGLDNVMLDDIVPPTLAMRG